jgi:acyl carrier protein|tara:strand:- start:831 stop:1097 length:267 start_codon:yes stop_codon:yes gene_type:complete
MFDKNKMADEIKRMIILLADQYSTLPDRINNDDIILDLGILDSPAIIELLCQYEEKYKFEIEKTEITMDNLGTVNKMVEFAIKKIQRI